MAGVFKNKFSITPQYLPKPSKRRSGLLISKVKFIVAHDTGNPKSSAAANVRFYINSKDEMSASAHLFVDDKEIIECVPAITAPPEKAWHVLYSVPRDNELYGVNANDAAIGVEYCYGENIDADKAYAKYLWTIAKICFDFELDPAKAIVGHCFLDPKRKTDPVTGLIHSRRTYDQLLRDIVTEYNDCAGIVTAPPALIVKPDAGTVTVAVKLNVRKEPNTRADRVQELAPGTVIEFAGIISNGQPVNNNPVWYKDMNGNYFWSGGVK